MTVIGEVFSNSDYAKLGSTENNLEQNETGVLVDPYEYKGMLT